MSYNIDMTDFPKIRKERIEALYGEAVADAIAETHRLGLPTTHVDEGGVYDEYPDGRKEYLKPE